MKTYMNPIVILLQGLSCFVSADTQVPDVFLRARLMELPGLAYGKK